MSEKLSGSLGVESSTGGGHLHCKFIVGGRVLVFPDDAFVSPPRILHNDNGDYREMTPTGKLLYDKVYKLGGKGVGVTGEPFTRSVTFGLETRPQECFRVEDIMLDETLNPPLDPFLERLLDQQKRSLAEQEA